MATNEELERILSRLAAGDIDTAEAAQRIAELKEASAPNGATRQVRQGDNAERPTDQETANGRPQFATFVRETIRRATTFDGASESGADSVEDSTAQADDEPKRAQSKGGVNRLVVRGVGRRIRVVGDQSVATVVAEGPHVLRRTGDTLEVTSEGEMGPNLDRFSLMRPPRSIDDLRDLSLDLSLGKELVLRVNPRIVVNVEVTAGALSISKLPRLGKIRVTAGGTTVNDVVELSDVLIQAGNASVSGPISEGRSRIRVESGNLSVRLSEGANVTIRSDAQLGRVSWPGDQWGQLDEYVVGNGSARLDVGVVMGHASIKLAND